MLALAECDFAHGSFDERVAEVLVAHVGNSVEFRDDGLEVSVDFAVEAERKWWIAASTGRQEAVGVKRGFEEGFVGWLLNRKLPSFHETAAALFPVDVELLPEYDAVESVCIEELPVDGDHRVFLCFVSHLEDGIGKQLVDDIRRLAHVLGTAFKRKAVANTRLIETLGRAPRRIQEGDSEVVAWLKDVFSERGYLAYYWRWREASRDLHPTPLSADLDDVPSDWLVDVGLGEGFVGTAAARLEVVVDNNVLEGVGRDTGIEAVLRHAKPGAPTRSALAVPVTSDHQFYGVLSLHGETAETFDDRVVSTVEDLAGVAANLFDDRTESMLREAHRSFVLRLLEALRIPMSPKEFWGHLSESLGDLTTKGFIESSALLVGRRNAEHLMTLKSAAPERPRRRLRFDLDSTHKTGQWLRQLVQSGIQRIHLEKGHRHSRALVPKEAGTLWLHPYRTDGDTDGAPLLVGLATVRPRSRYTQPLGTRPLGDEITSWFSSVFAVTRAILTAEDLTELSRQQKWLMAAETHDVLQPINTIRNAAERLESKSESDRNRQRRIIAAAEDLRVRRENVIYRLMPTPGEHKELEMQKKEVVSLPELVEETIAKGQQKAPGQLFHLQVDEPPEAWEWSVKGYRRWLSIAIQNVVNNAIKFGQNAPIEIRLTRNREPTSRQPELQIQVTDHGIGIPDDQLKAIFRAGNINEYSRRQNVDGSQIALATTLDIIEAHGGKIWAYSKLGMGSTFFITFPLLQGGNDS